MAASTEADLKEFPSSYQSSRARWDLLLGEDPAAAVLKSVISDENDTQGLRILLSERPWTDIALEKRHTIYSEDRPRNNDQDVRRVSAMPTSHLERIFAQAARRNKLEAVSALLNFASSTKGVKLSSLFNYDSLWTPISKGWYEVIETMASFYPEVVKSHLPHSSPLECASAYGRTEVVAVLLRHGAKPNARSLQTAASKGHLSILEMLLQHGAPVKGNAALHLAARQGNFDGINLLLDHGAGIDDVPPRHGWGRTTRWTPMHFAASEGLAKVIELLESKGSRSADTKDHNGKTPAHLFIEYKLGKSWKELRGPSTATLASLAADTTSDAVEDAEISSK